jgi:hypothetical protein
LLAWAGIFSIGDVACLFAEVADPKRNASNEVIGVDITRWFSHFFLRNRLFCAAFAAFVISGQLVELTC